MASILIVDDTETEHARLTGLLLANDEHDVMTAGSGEEALIVMQERKIDLVITDLRMSGMSGIELTETLQERCPRVPIILMSAYGSEEETVQGIQRGASGYLNKTAAPQELCPLVQRLLDARATDLAHAEVIRRRQIDEYELKLPSQRTLMSATAAFLRQRIQAAELCAEKELLRLGIALEEALLNACLHGNLELESVLREDGGDQFEALADERGRLDPWMRRRIYVSARITQEQARIVVRDEGAGFDPSQLPDPTDPENLLKPHGRGVMIMKMFLDEVEWNAAGNQVTMVMNARDREPQPQAAKIAANRRSDIETEIRHDG